MKKLKILGSVLLISLLVGCTNDVVNDSNSIEASENMSNISNIEVEDNKLENNSEVLSSTVGVQDALKNADNILSVLPNALNTDFFKSENTNEVESKIKSNIDSAYDTVYNEKVEDINEFLSSDLFVYSDLGDSIVLTYKGDAKKFNCLYFFEGTTGAYILTEDDINICLYNMLIAFSSYDNSKYNMYNTPTEIFDINKYSVEKSYIGEKIEGIERTNETIFGSKAINEYDLNSLIIRTLKDTDMVIETETKISLDEEDSVYLLLEDLGYKESILRVEKIGVGYVDIKELGTTIGDFKNTIIRWQHSDGYEVYIKVLENGEIVIKKSLFYYDNTLPLFYNW